LLFIDLLIIYLCSSSSWGLQLHRTKSDHWSINHHNPDLVQGPGIDKCRLLQLEVHAGHDGTAENLIW